MRVVALTFSVLLCSVSWLPATLHAQTQAKTQETKPVDSKSEDATTIVYKPPMRGAPARRVGGATRGDGDKDLVLQVLAPEQTGLTEQAQPTLYWYVSKPATMAVELTLIADAAETPVLARNVSVTQAGVQSVDLAQLGITLRPDTDYEWFVSVVPDTGRRSKDLTSGGVIRRVSVDPGVQSRASAAGASGAPRVYAEAG
ncbi:MAG: DUF928 domain-containing protein, partial [Burkholderiaceae bacterium]